MLLSISVGSTIFLYFFTQSLNSYSSKTPCLILYSNFPPSEFFSLKRINLNALLSF